jgi:predicted GNAT family acetyltransferase
MKVQSFKNLSGYINKSEDFLFKNEVSNNLFWEVLEELKKKPTSTHWAANVMDDGNIRLSVIRTPSNYLMLSKGDKLAGNHLLNYLKKKNPDILGFAGPELLSLPFHRNWMKSSSQQHQPEKNFLIFKSTSKTPRVKDIGDHGYTLKIVGEREWPRARLWAIQFARESTPELSATEIVASAKKMMRTHSLFFLHKKDSGSCGMAGFGRQTRNYKVINLVYVPTEHRSCGVGKNLILQLLKRAKTKENKKCLLFSDYSGDKNLYSEMGFRLESQYSESSFVSNFNP